MAHKRGRTIPAGGADRATDDRFPRAKRQDLQEDSRTGAQERKGGCGAPDASGIVGTGTESTVAEEGLQGDASPFRAEQFERYAVALAFILYLIFQTNAALHHGSMGQDFEIHKGWIAAAVAAPGRFFFHYDAGRTNPPLGHLLYAMIYKLTGGVHWLEVIALVMMLINAVSLLLLYKMARGLIANKLIRISFIIFILFLPCVMIHAIVLASDALATPIFIATVYFLSQMSRPLPNRTFLVHALKVAAMLILGLGVKFTFGSLLVATFVSLFTLAWVGIMGRRQLIGGLAIMVGIPSAVALTEVVTFEKQQNYNLAIGVTGSEMSLRNICLFGKNDLHILDAPPYDERSPVEYSSVGNTPAHHMELIVANKYSYPALLHLSTFTDVLNIYQYDPNDSYFGRRTAANQFRMRLGVRAGVPITFAVLILCPLIVFHCSRQVLRRNPQSIVIVIVALAGGFWFLNIAGGMPFVQAYWMGFWLSRLVIPAILSALMITFVGFDALTRRCGNAIARAVLTLVLFESAVHASFLWPWGEQASAAPIMPVKAIAAPQAPCSKQVNNPFLRVRLEATIAFPDRPAGWAREPILVTGVPCAGDFVYVRYLGGRRVKLGFNHWGSAALPETAPFFVPEGHFSVIVVNLDRIASLVTIGVDGIERLRYTQSLYPAAPSQVTVGRNDIGGLVIADEFEGQISGLTLREEPPSAARVTDPAH